MNVLIFVVVLLCSVLAENVSESESTSNGTVSSSREARQIRYVSYDNGRPLFGPGPPSRIMPRIGSNNGMQTFNNHPPRLPPNMMIRRRVQSLPTSMIMKGKNPRITMPKPHNIHNPHHKQQPIVNSRPQAVKPYPRGPPPKQFFPTKLPTFSKAQVSAAENKFKASVPFNGNVIVKAAPPLSSDYKYETPAANSIRPSGLHSDKGYSVYEVTDDLAQQKPVFNFPKQQPQPTSSPQSQYQFYQTSQQHPQQPQQQQHQLHAQPQYQQIKKQVSNDEAKRYMTFMGSNQYFLPKSEPDYRKMPSASPSEEVKFYDIRKQQMKSLKTVVPTTPVLTYYNTQTESSPNSKFNYPVNYYSDETLSATGPSGKNNFKSPPPERFEFTENDAIHGTYTSSPVLKSYESEQQEIFNNLNRRHSQDQHEEKEEEVDEDEVMIATANVGFLSCE